jgi:hypothetical protein
VGMSVVSVFDISRNCFVVVVDCWLWVVELEGAV